MPRAATCLTDAPRSRCSAATVLGLLMICTCAVAFTAELTVSDTGDSGPGSLRRAMEDANASPGPDTIVFAIPESQCGTNGVCEIEVLSDLPEITDGLVVDGTTQPRYGSAPANVCATADEPLRPRIQITGDVDHLLWVTSSDPVSIRGLALGEARFPIRADAGGRVIVQCNLFGRSVDGTRPLWFDSGVCLSCFGAAAASAIVGTDGDGVDDEREGNVFVYGGAAVNINHGDDYAIAGNLVGLRPDGVTVDPVSTGVYIRQSATGNRVGSNLDGISDELERNIFGGASRAVWIESWAGFGDRNLVTGNWIGLNTEGEPGSVETAVLLGSDGQHHVVAQNRIESTSTGLLVKDGASLSPSSTGNCIEGNTVGLRHEGDADGLAAAQSWWGAESGPSGLGAGTGDSIENAGTGSVAFEPWLTSPGGGCTTLAPFFRIVIPAAAAAPGAAGSYFVTDLEINNRGATAADFVLRWLPRNTDTTSPATSAPFALAPGSSIRLDSVLETAFGLDQGSGALVVESSSPHLLAMSRTYNQSGDGTFGQSLPGVPPARLVTAGERARILFMTENADYRANLGLVNGAGRPLTIHFRLYDETGIPLGEDVRSLPAWGNTQVNRVLAPHEPIDGAYVDVWTDTPGGVFTCYGSVLDNGTSDPTTVLPN